MDLNCKKITIYTKLTKLYINLKVKFFHFESFRASSQIRLLFYLQNNNTLCGDSQYRFKKDKSISDLLFDI